MGRLIDVDKFKAVNSMKDDCADCDKELRGKSKTCDFDRNYSKMDFCGWLDDAPTVDAVPVRHGRWEHHPEIGWGSTWLCSECGEKTVETVMGEPRYKFCPMCGADMRKDGDGK